MKRIAIVLAGVVSLASCKPSDGLHSLHVLSVNDVHGAWVDTNYVNGSPVVSLMSDKHIADSLRSLYGKENTLFIDAGDNLQGDQAPYYYNYVVPEKKHLYPLIADYMGYDAVVVGNHEIETGHDVYDRVRKDLKSKHIPYLAGNAIKVEDGSRYFDVCKLFRRSGLKVLVLGYTNANIKSWLQEELWSGMDFLSLLPLVQNDVDRYMAKYKPQVVIVAVHSGTGAGDGSVLESQGLDLLYSLKGVDLVINAHDHAAYVEQYGDVCLMNAGNKAKYVGHATVDIEIERGEVASRRSSAELIAANAFDKDEAMHERFSNEWNEVREYTGRRIGSLDFPISTREAFSGTCDYMNLLHTVQLSVPESKISFCAPLTYNRTLNEGDIHLYDLFTLYPFENELFVLDLTGDEIRSYLEYSYNLWLSDGNENTLNISRTEKGWRFNEPTYNLDSAAGLVYTVDITQPYGKRVSIKSLADGTPFSLYQTYPVSVNSYRASGSKLFTEGAGLSSSDIQERIIATYPAVRNLIGDFFENNDKITKQMVSDPLILGEWHFVPSDAGDKIRKDISLLFPEGR